MLMYVSLIRSVSFLSFTLRFVTLVRITSVALVYFGPQPLEDRPRSIRQTRALAQGREEGASCIFHIVRGVFSKLRLISHA